MLSIRAFPTCLWSVVMERAEVQLDVALVFYHGIEHVCIGNHLMNSLELTSCCLNQEHSRDVIVSGLEKELFMKYQ